MNAAAVRSDYEGLGLLMRRAGVETARVEAMVREFLAMQAEERIAQLHVRELQSLREAVGEGLEAIRADQDAALKGMSLALTTFRREAHVYQSAFAAATRRTCAVAAALILLQLVTTALGAAVLAASRPGAGPVAPAELEAGKPAARAGSLHFAALPKNIALPGKIPR